MDKISDLKQIVINTLDINKAQDIVSIDLKDKSSMADFMIIASGTSSRHIQSLSEQVLEKLKYNGVKDSKIEGKDFYSSIEWPKVEKSLLVEEEVIIVVQVNGKKRGILEMPINSKEKTIIEKSKKVDNVSKNLEGQKIVKNIYIKNKIINFIIKK